jgi:type II secretory ATPase GspE/PulE/Tfp pilus assembly ATPase PilB-like protein/CheY-like chemotaxis protein
MPSRKSQAVSPRHFPRDGWVLAALEREGALAPETAARLRSDAPEWVAGAVVEMGLLSADRVEALAAKAAVTRVADLARIEPAAVQFVPEVAARQYAALPLSATNRVIRLATPNPLDLDAEQALAFVAGRQVEFDYCLPGRLRQRLEEVYRPERSIERLVGGLGAEATIEAVDEEPAPPAEVRAAIDAPTARLVDATIADAVRERASDVHFEPSDEGLLVRYRVDGVLREVMRVPRSAAGAVVRRLKVLAKLDVTDPLHPHDGRAGARVDGKPWDLRVSSIPVARLGEKVVVRLLDPAGANLALGAMGLWPDELATLEALLRFREGIVLVTGPTGSGKTSTLYAALGHIKRPGLNVVTVEDPVEYRLPGVNQIQVSEKSGFTFAAALRSVLRQDPDLVLLGEIRDTETASTAWQASLTGHFVLSTLHTNDAVSSVMRLRDLGVDAYQIASALKGVVAQRLLRRLCPRCAEPARIESLPNAARPPKTWDRQVRVMAPKGCGQCGFTGYRGRFAIQEQLTVDGAVAELIAKGALAGELVRSGRRYGMRTLYEAALRRVWAGETGYDELVRVVGEAPAQPGAVAPPETAPATPATAAQPVESVTPAARERPLILIADDDPALRTLIKAVLTSQGFDAAEACDGAEALEQTSRLHPDLVLLDMDMPRLGGLDVLRTLRERLSGRAVPVVVITASEDAELEAQCIELGAEDYLTKPVQPSSLMARVRAVLRRAGARAPVPAAARPG